ncbi:MAG TPA: DUF domain-containing protein [Nitrososphaeraceae archaeon]
MTTSTTDSIHLTDLTDLTDLTQKTQKNKGGRPSNSIWEDINKGKSIGSGKFAASCKYCDNTWPRGEVFKLEEHLSNHCSGAPAAVVRKYMAKVVERQDKKPLKKRKHSEDGQQSIRSYHDSTEIPDSRITRINRALVKFFIACRMSFRIVEHPFFINFVKELNARYDPPSRECLAGQLLERELALVNSKVNSEIEQENSLTLAFDGWTSGTHRSIWNFIITTPSRKEYLYQLSDLSENSHTAVYLTEVIESIINKVGANKIAAIVLDNAANVRNARELIQEKHPNIENVRCIAHSINLIACDIIKESFGDRLLRRVNVLSNFFKSSHQAGSKLTQLIKEKKIAGGGIKSYSKTRWTTAAESIDSVINLEPVLEELVIEHHHLLTNDKIKPIIQAQNFFADLRILSFILDPLKKTILNLESRSATLGDCFLGLIRLAAVLKKLPTSFNPSFRSHCVKIINERLEEFNDDRYITCFFLNPRFRDAPLKKGSFKKILKCCVMIGQRQGFDRYECEVLCDQLRKYKDGADPFDLDLAFAKDNATCWWKLISTEPEPEVLSKVACHLFAISPNSASCERRFSTLGWLFNKRRLNLKLETLESMGKLISYWKSNSKTELGFYGLDNKNHTRLSDTDINIQIAEALADDDDDSEDPRSADNTTSRRTTSGEVIPEDTCYVLIEDSWIGKLVDLSHDLITEGIEIPRDIQDDLDESDKEGDRSIIDNNVNDGRIGRGDFNYNIEDFLVEEEEEDKEDDEQQ